MDNALIFLLTLNNKWKKIICWGYNIIIRKFVYRILRRRWESVKAIYPGYLKKKRERVFRNIVCTCGLKEQKTCSNIPKHL